MEHKPPSRLGLLFGIAMILALVLLDIGLVIATLSSPIDLLTVGRVLLLILTLPTMGVFLYGLVGLQGARYTVDRNAIIIHWGAVSEVIPLPNVEEILQGTDLGHVARFRGLRWPGYWVGRGRIDSVGAVQFYCTTAVDHQLVIKTRANSFAISPKDPDKFMDLFATQRGMGISEELGQTLIQPQILHRGFFSDRTAGLLLALGGILNLLLYAILAAQYSRLPYTLPLHFDRTGVPDRVCAPSQLFTLIALGTVAWLVDGVLGIVIYRRFGERVAACLLWGAAAGLQILLWFAIAGLIRI